MKEQSINSVSFCNGIGRVGGSGEIRYPCAVPMQDKGVIRCDLAIFGVVSKRREGRMGH